VASALGLNQSDIGTGIFFGALTMLFYSIGLTIPLLILGSGASEMGKRMNRTDVKVVGGFLLILIGVVIGIITIVRMFSLWT
jgi:cytochrome c biogenesis protein CcdA